MHSLYAYQKLVVIAAESEAKMCYYKIYLSLPHTYNDIKNM